jgi:perosamine synthetase
VSIPITKPFFGDEELAAVQKPIESGWVVQGEYVAEFERLFGDYTGAAHSVATSSCTTALQIALAALGVGPGDEVVVPAFTWISTANVVEVLGAKAVFCDVDLATFNATAETMAPHVGPNAVGLLPVHLFGVCADLDPILELARSRGLWVVEDAACALGAWYRGRHAGTFGEAGAFSFHPKKSVTTGEGGMLTTGSDDLADAARSLRDHGASRSDFDRHHERGAFLLAEYRRLGLNFRLTDLQGALGCAQMRRVEWILGERRRVAARYDELLADVEWLIPQRVPDDQVHGYQSYVCLFAPDEPTLDNLDRLHERRNALMAQLEQRGIATRQGTHAAALQQYYVDRYGISPADFPNAALAERLSLALPLYPQLTDAEIELVVDELRSAF